MDDIRFVALLAACLCSGGISLFELSVHQGMAVGATEGDVMLRLHSRDRIKWRHRHDQKEKGDNGREERHDYSTIL